MQIFALKKSLVDKVREERGTDLAFDHIFGKKRRFVIPLVESRMVEIIEMLERGDTISKRKYSVDIEKQVATKVVQTEMGPKMQFFRLGKVIQAELGQVWINAYAQYIKHFDPNDKTRKYIVITRDPVDIARMSDHKTWTSCHAPHREYFDHALQESIDGGGVAYIITAEDLQILQDPDAEEVFKDDDRRVGGIVPTARLRINRYVTPTGQEIAIPTDHTYGRNVNGFYDSVRNFFKEKQKDVLPSPEKIKLSTWKRMGGIYADASDSSIFSDFFGVSINGSAQHEGRQHNIEIWEEEVTAIVERYRDQLEYVDFYASVEESDGEQYIMCGFSFSFEFKLEREIGDILEEYLFGEYVKQLIGRDFGNIYASDADANVEYEVKDNILRIMVGVDPESPANPDGVDDVGRDLVAFEKKDFFEMKAVVHEGLAHVDQRIIGEFLKGENWPFTYTKKHIEQELGGDSTQFFRNFSLTSFVSPINYEEISSWSFQTLIVEEEDYGMFTVRTPEYVIADTKKVPVLDRIFTSLRAQTEKETLAQSLYAYVNSKLSPLIEGRSENAYLPTFDTPAKRDMKLSMIPNVVIREDSLVRFYMELDKETVFLYTLGDLHSMLNVVDSNFMYIVKDMWKVVDSCIKTQFAEELRQQDEARQKFLEEQSNQHMPAPEPVVTEVAPQVEPSPQVEPQVVKEVTANFNWYKKPQSKSDILLAKKIFDKFYKR